MWQNSRFCGESTTKQLSPNERPVSTPPFSRIWCTRRALKLTLMKSFLLAYLANASFEVNGYIGDCTQLERYRSAIRTIG